MRTEQSILEEIVDGLNKSLQASQIPGSTFAAIAGVNYVTFNKYLNGRKSVGSLSTNEKLLRAIEDVNAMVEAGILPVPDEISRSHIKRVVLREYKKFKNQN